MARLFVALWPEDGLRRSLRDWREPCYGGRGTRLVAPEQLHLTLHFLGEVPSQQVQQLRRALGVPLRAFELCFSRCERWPGGVLVVPADAVPTALADLHGTLGEVLRSFGLATEMRAFRPHITLGRRHTGPVPPAAAATLRWDVRAYVLVESGARAGGGYEVIATYE